ncbi:hypothetical protein RhoFasK5_00447|nr:hypothetical protein [Rhodococcus kroppenstedtii]
MPATSSARRRPKRVAYQAPTAAPTSAEADARPPSNSAICPNDNPRSDRNGPTNADPIEFPNLYATISPTNTTTPGRRNRAHHAPASRTAEESTAGVASADSRVRRNASTGRVDTRISTAMTTNSARHPASENSQSRTPPPTIMPIRYAPS